MRRRSWCGGTSARVAGRLLLGRDSLRRDSRKEGSTVGAHTDHNRVFVLIETDDGEDSEFIISGGPY